MSADSTQADAAAGAENNPNTIDSPKEVHIHGLVVLPPRQQRGSIAAAHGGNNAVALPPLRSEEAVASLRGALSEIVGFGQLTRFRLVLERIDGNDVDGGAEGGDAVNGNKKKGANGYGNGNGSAGGVLTADKEHSVISPYTLKHALVTVPPSVKTLENHDDDDNDADREDEIVLDEYGDLSVLVGLLDGTQDSEADNAQAATVLNANEKYAIRLVLERYNLAAVRDQIARVRNLLAGNAPALKTLILEEGGSQQIDGKENGEAEEQLDASKKEDAQQSKADDDMAEDEDAHKSNAKEAADKSKEEATAQREAMAKKLPKFPPNYDLTHSKATHGDFTQFYHLACGEEHVLLPKEAGEKKASNGSHIVSDDDWIDDDSNSKKKKGKSQKKKSKNNNGGANNHPNNINKINGVNSNKSSKPTFSVPETERLLYTLNSQTIIECTIRLSGYHSPPSHRRILGDLAYIEAILPGSATIHITAFSLGFYVNKTNAIGFDPTPASEACYSHSLLDCLLQKSKTLREAWAVALQASEKRAEVLKNAAMADDAFAQLYRPATSTWWNNHSGTAMGSGLALPAPSTFTPRLDSVTLRPSWLVPLPRVGNKRMDTWTNHSNLHKWNVARCEDELTATYGMDVRGGGIRDWNEELQAARDLGVETLEERMDRARMIHKVLSDFSDAALHGVRAILDGYITPMNPNESARSHVYLHNNIFFSRAVDAGLDTFKIIQGDSAAKKSASREARNVGVIHRLDIPGLYTLGTVLVEHLGTRFVCQSVVPGILHGEKAHTLAYGSVEALSELRCDPEMHKVLEDSIGEECMVATRGILSKPLSDERVELIKKFKSTLPFPVYVKEELESKNGNQVKVNQVCGPVEMKGIIGSDKRKYVLDCTRLTPRDANWVGKSDGGTGYWEEVSSSTSNSKTSDLIPSTLADDEWTAAVLRPELVTSYADEKLKQFLLNRQVKEADKSSNCANTDENETPTDEDKDKEWVDVKTSGDKKETDTEKLRKEEEEFIQSLRYNVNVFLPYMKSIESVDKDAYEQLQNDEEEARKLASFLWNTVLPDVTNKLRLDNGKTFQVPLDGKNLTEFLHKRGVNCRYLGRLADLAKIEEQNDTDAEEAYEKNKKENKLPRFRMPLCWLELLECEMVARAAKHVLDSYLTENGGTAAVQPAQTVASFLSAVISTGEETASETEHRTAVSMGDAIDSDDINSLTLFDVGGNGDAVHKPVRGRAKIWSDIEKEVGRRFRYTLSLYNNDAQKSRALYTPLLRRICQRSGIRIAAKAYDVGKKCVCGGGSNSGGRLDYSYPIAAVDIIDVLPLVKHAASSGEESFAPCRFDGNTSSTLHIVLADARAISEAALRHLNSGNIALASDYAQEAASLYQRVVESPLHVQIAKCIHLLSKCHFYGQDHSAAIQSSLKYLAVSVSLGGFDCMEAVSAHNQLSDAYFAAGKVQKGIKHVRAVQFLMEFLAGANYSQLSAMYYKVGTQYFEGEKLVEALSFYDVAQNKRTDDRMVDGIVASSAAMAMAHLGKFSEARNEEKIAYQLYQALLGEDHDRTKISSSSLLQFMRLSMEQGKLAAAQKSKLNKENEADAIAQSIKAEEDKAESGTKKKKKKKKGKGENTPENTAQNASKAS